MNIKLIYLPHLHLKQPEAQAPMGLMYLASVLKKKHQVTINNFASFSTYKAIEFLEEADMYGISITSLELLQANRFAHLIKEKFPKSKVILGGPGTISDTYVDWNIIDSICKGEGEITIFEMLKDINNLKKIYNGKIVKNIDNIPFPSRELLLCSKQGGNIFAYNKKYRKGGSTQILTSRGCPYKCAFCCAPALTTKVRYRSAKNIVEEIKSVIDNYGIRQFRFADDLFVYNKNRLKKVCEAISKLDIIWRISARCDIFDEEASKMLLDAGCREVSFGCESFDTDVLKMLKKRTTAEINAKALETAITSGMNARCLMMIKTPGQTKYTVRKNIEWLSRIPFSIVACSIFVPIPGSEIWNFPDKFDIKIIDKNLDNYNFYFFGREGAIDIKNIIQLKGRNEDEVNEESQEFRDWLNKNGKINKG